MRATADACLLVLPLLIALILTGCATEALELAPEAADKPWKMTAARGEPASTTGGPDDFSVPSNPSLARIADPVAIDTNARYNLAQLIDIAQRSNPTTRNAWEQARQAALSVGMVEATMLPVITANVIGGVQETTVPVEVPLLGRRDIDTRVEGVTPSIALQWLVFDFGQRAALADAAEQVSFAANVTFNAAHQKVIFDVTRSYYLYSASVVANRIAQETLRNSEAVAAAAQANFDEGRATTVETALARQQVAQSELRIVRAQGQQQDAYQALLAAMGVNAMLKIKINGSLDGRLPAGLDRMTQSVLDAALSRRPDVIASFAALQASRAGVQAAEAEFLPKIFVAATLASTSDSFDVGNLPAPGNQASGVGVLVGATVPLYDAGLRAAQLKKAQSAVGAAAETLRQVQLDAATEIMVASNALRTALAANKAAGVLVQTSETAFDAALASYKNGLGTVTVVNETNNALLDARLAQTDARAAARIAAANLAFLTGALTSNRSVLPGVTMAGSP